ncbi:MAG: glycogen/starch synthase [Mobilitalea sp.]
MNRKISILYVAAEISPYANAGGLGEVGRSFPQALSNRGDFEVRRVMPLYKGISKNLEYVTDFPVEMGKDYETCIIKKDTMNTAIPTYFVENARYFYRDSIYGFDDDGMRYFFFCKAVIEMMKKLSYEPDIVHTNDWHTGFLPLFLKKTFPHIKSVYTIHNISYHGYIHPSYLDKILTQKEQFDLGWPGWLNFMKAGIIHSDLLTTVSPGYCDEIKQPAISCGMSGIIEKRKNGIVGILNGIDTESYQPKQEGEIEYPYDFGSIEIKKKNKSFLRSKYGLSDNDKPLIAMITRLDYTKGIDALIKALSFVDMNSMQVVILGSGSAYYQSLLANIAAGYPKSVAVDFEYSSLLAKQIYAAADIYLMPSLFEPCGLGQLYAMRYGAVPIVNPVGGLKDTVCDDPENIEKSSGFYMEEWSGEALAKAIERAVKTYQTPVWKKYIKNCMEFDSSWKHSVEEYVIRYEEVLKDKK